MDLGERRVSRARGLNSPTTNVDSDSSAPILCVVCRIVCPRSKSKSPMTHDHEWCYGPIKVDGPSSGEKDLSQIQIAWMREKRKNKNPIILYYFGKSTIYFFMYEVRVLRSRTRTFNSISSVSLCPPRPKTHQTTPPIFSYAPFAYVSPCRNAAEAHKLNPDRRPPNLFTSRSDPPQSVCVRYFRQEDKQSFSGVGQKIWHHHQFEGNPFYSSFYDPTLLLVWFGFSIFAIRDAGLNECHLFSRRHRCVRPMRCTITVHPPFRASCFSYFQRAG